MYCVLFRNVEKVLFQFHLTIFTQNVVKMLSKFGTCVKVQPTLPMTALEQNQRLVVVADVVTALAVFVFVFVLVAVFVGLVCGCPRPLLPFSLTTFLRFGGAVWLLL